MKKVLLALAFLTTACYAGNFYPDPVITPDTQAMQEDSQHLAKECKKKNSRSCYELGMRYSGSRLYQHSGYSGVPVNHSKAFEYLQRACDLKHADACCEVGILYEHGWGVRQSWDHAYDQYKLACNRKSGKGCKCLANLYERGKGVWWKSKSSAKKYYGKSCDYGYQEGCDHYAAMVR